MKVILHADDFGFDKDTTEATIELLERGALSSATIMATMPKADMAIAYAAKHPEFSFGVHLTYVDGLKPAKLSTETSLTDKNGLFYPSNDVRKKAVLMKLKEKDIVEESLAQIAKVRLGGAKISHLDSHGHLHKFPSFLLALPEIKKQSGINRVRRVQNVFVNNPKLSPTTILNHCFDWRIASTCKTTDYFYMSANSMDTGWADAILTQMDKLPKNAVIEVGVHPGHADTEEERWRIAEYSDIVDFAEKLRRDNKHQIITWKDV
ncbi:MAG: ChbG/HpnK family deacetylase [Prevotella sp.]|nr:ChbG/HpnK family deacetylase [Prevotella sp.]